MKCGGDINISLILTRGNCSWQKHKWLTADGSICCLATLTQTNQQINGEVRKNIEGKDLLSPRLFRLNDNQLHGSIPCSWPINWKRKGKSSNPASVSQHFLCYDVSKNSEVRKKPNFQVSAVKPVKFWSSCWCNNLTGTLKTLPRHTLLLLHSFLA